VPRLDPGIETRSLNLVCYRQGQQGCRAHQIQVARWQEDAPAKDKDALDRAVATLYLISVTDETFMQALRQGYEDKLCGFWRRIFSLKSLRSVQL
jgi:hypothetical protein